MVSKSKEEQLQDWKTKRTVKPLNKLCPNVIVKDSGRSLKSAPRNGGRHAFKGNRMVSKSDKENSAQGLTDGNAGCHTHGKKKCLNDASYLDVNTQKWLGNIEGDWNQLSEQLNVLKRQSLRGSTALSAGDYWMVPAGNGTSGNSALGSQFTLPRESLALPPSPNGSVFEPISTVEGQNLMALADQLFTEAAFVELCEKGMNARLQRTRDGATAESRINELAGECKKIVCQ
jgi:hypothetical protein